MWSHDSSLSHHAIVSAITASSFAFERSVMFEFVVVTAALGVLVVLVCPRLQATAASVSASIRQQPDGTQ
jgi:hypothetical protein